MIYDPLLSIYLAASSSAEEVQSLKEEEIVEQLHQEKNELQIKLEKLEKALHTMNAQARQVCIHLFCMGRTLWSTMDKMYHLSITQCIETICNNSTTIVHVGPMKRNSNIS